MDLAYLIPMNWVGPKVDLPGFIYILVRQENERLTVNARQFQKISKPNTWSVKYLVSGLHIQYN